MNSVKAVRFTGSGRLFSDRSFRRLGLDLVLDLVLVKALLQGRRLL